MNDAPLAGGGRVEAKWLARFANPLCGNSGRKLQLFQTRGSVIAAIKTNAIVQAGVEPQATVRNVFERQQKLGISFQKQRIVAASQCDG